MKTLRNFLIFAVLVAVAGGGAYFYKQSASEKGAAGGGPPGRGGGPGGTRVQTVTVSAVKAEVGSIDERLTLTGALKPKEQVDVTPKSTGRLQSIHYHIGDRVNVGDLIAELERDEIEQQVRRAEAAIQVSRASLEQRKAELRNSQTMLQRAEQLRADGLISPQDFDMQTTQTAVVESQVELSEAQLRQTEAELRELKIRLEQTRIFAPIDGLIATRYVDVGALLGPSTPIVRVVNLNTMITAASVPEREVGKLRVGNQARVRVDAFGDREFTGRVARISPVLDAATRSAMIEIEIRNPNSLLKAEMFARVELDLSSTRETVLIPREALVYRGAQPGVYLINGEVPEFRSIETGLTQEGRVEVIANLEPGTEVVGRGSSMLSTGDRIRVEGRAGPGAPGRGPGGGPGGGPDGKSASGLQKNDSRVAQAPSGAMTAKPAQ